MGAGVFLNTVEVSKRAGILGAFAYTFIGLLLLPLIASIATLMRMHPSGGFYAFAQKEIGNAAGFANAWIYFTGKLASSTIIIHSSVVTLQQLVPSLAYVHTFVLDAFILSIFIGLNLLDIKASSAIQKLFIVFKCLPIGFVIVSGLYLWNPGNLADHHYVWQGLSSTLPLVLYAAMGFEATCSLSDKIKNASRNGPIAIYVSYAIALSIMTLYQAIFYIALGDQLVTFASYREAFPALCAQLFPAALDKAYLLGGLFNIAIAVSALGGAYGILFSNMWNLHTLAHNRQIIGASLLSRVNRYSIPFLCLLAEGFISGLYLIVTQGNQVALQQLAALSATLAYTMSVFALLKGLQKRHASSFLHALPWCGLLSCSILLFSCLRALMVVGMGALGLFACLGIVGACAYWTARPSHDYKQTTS